jgi:hypothetical protein
VKVKYTIVAGALVTLIGVGGVAAPAGATSVTTLSRNNDTLIQDMQDISSAASDSDVEELASACDSLEGHALQAMAYTRPKVVPRSAWRHMRAAWLLFQESGNLCASGARSFDSDELEQAVDYMSQGSEEIDLATKLLR